jgi:hypothetical protein
VNQHFNYNSIPFVNVIEKINSHRMKKNLLLVAAFGVLLASGCLKDNYEILHPAPKVVSQVCDTAKTISFTTDITPIINFSCAISGCHDAASGAGGITLNNYKGVHGTVLSGQLIPAIKHTGPNSGTTYWMPITGSLSPCEIGIINKWVNNGALNN